MKYHLSADGEPRVCRAEKGKCPYADSEHFTNLKSAREEFERRNKTFAIPREEGLSHVMPLSDETSKLIDSLYGVGFEPYVVGGSVRDSLLSGAIPKDIDIEVFGVRDMASLEKSLQKAGYSVDSVGESFGVLKTKLNNGEDIDISMPRRDSKTQDGHRGFEVEVDPTMTLEEAAGRRDFTINSLYYSKRDEKILDPYEGVLDYRAGVLRHINEHFGEDPLRVLRGVQFASRFKMKLHDDTAAESQKLLKEYDTISPERFQTEFEKMFTKGDVAWGLNALHDTRWDRKFHLNAMNPQLPALTQRAIDRAKNADEDSAVFGAARLLSAVPPAHREAVADAFLTNNKRQKKALSLIDVRGPVDNSELNVNAWTRQLWRAKKLTSKDFYLLHGNEGLKIAAEKMGVFEKPIVDYVTGDMVLSQGNKKPGVWVGEVLKRANAAQDAGVFGDKASAQRWLEENLEEPQSK